MSSNSGNFCAGMVGPSCSVGMLQTQSLTFFNDWKCISCGADVKANVAHGIDDGCLLPTASMIGNGYVTSTASVYQWKFCPDCGAKLGVGWNFCGQCGCRLHGAPPVTYWPAQIPNSTGVWPGGVTVGHNQQTCAMEEFVRLCPGQPANLYCSCPKCSPRC